jgi:biopolymer transport protein ExbD
MQERVRQKMEGRSDKEVYLRGDGGVQLQELLDIMDRLKDAGVEKVGIVAKMPGER